MWLAATAATALIQGCGAASDPDLNPTETAGTVPRFDHVVIAVMENQGFSTIANSSSKSPGSP